MKIRRHTFSILSALALGLLVSGARAASAQTTPAQGTCKVSNAQAAKDDPQPAPDAEGGIRLVVKDSKGTPLQRKRFYLLERNIQEGVRPDWAGAPDRGDYLKGASAQLQEWLKRHDCDSLYCPEYEAEYAEAVKTVPEFKKAYDEGLRKYKNQKLAMRWLMVNFPLKNVRTEFYKRKKAWLEQAAGKAGKVTSAMTDEKGEAFFTGLRLKSYYVSNLLPLEDGGVIWNCAVTVTPLVKLHYSVTVELGYPKPAAPAAASK